MGEGVHFRGGMEGIYFRVESNVGRIRSFWINRIREKTNPDPNFHERIRLILDRICYTGRESIKGSMDSIKGKKSPSTVDGVGFKPTKIKMVHQTIRPSVPIKVGRSRYTREGNPSNNVGSSLKVEELIRSSKYEVGGGVHWRE